MSWAKVISEKAMEVTASYEKGCNRYAKEMHTKGVGYDIKSTNDEEERFIEVKGVSERWETYTWQALHYTEIDCLNKYPNKFFLYIIYFHIPLDISRSKENVKEIEKAEYDIYIIPGKELLSKFSLHPTTYSLSPISRRKLNEYKIDN